MCARRSFHVSVLVLALALGACAPGDPVATIPASPPSKTLSFAPRLASPSGATPIPRQGHATASPTSGKTQSPGGSAYPPPEPTPIPLQSYPIGAAPATPWPYAPPVKDVEGEVSIDFAELHLDKQAPYEPHLYVRGNLPSPCHRLQSESTLNSDLGRLDVRAFSVANAQAQCTDRPMPFEKEIPLGKLEAGSYSLYLNDKLVQEFSLSAS